jgi:hypothetical protein
MGKNVKKIVLVIGCVLLAGFVYWQFIKKGVINQAIAKSVNKGSDGDYYIRYDHSTIDEINGNASFRNIVLQSDSLQQQLYRDDTINIDREIFNIRVGELKITGANIPSLLRKNTVSAKQVEIIQPYITIIRTGAEPEYIMSKEDSLALYDRITGKFNSINADEIIIRDGTVAFANGKQQPHTTIKGINIQLKNFRIDSTRNYDNLVSYFVKDINATIQSVNTINAKNGNQFLLEGVEYSAPGRFIKVNSILQKDLRSGEILINLKDNSVTGISTNDFIINRKIKADSIRSSGGIVSLYRNKKMATSGEALEIDNDFFDEVQIRNVSMGKSMLNIYNRQKPGTAPLRINNFRLPLMILPSKRLTEPISEN